MVLIVPCAIAALPAGRAILPPADLAALDRWCAWALDDPGAEPRDGDEAAAVARYEALLAERARDVLKASPVPRPARARQRPVQASGGALWRARGIVGGGLSAVVQDDARC
jgi:hypothetical protein